MKCYLFFFRKVRWSLLLDSSYSTVRACIVSFVFVFLAINCGPPPQGKYHAPETAIKAAQGQYYVPETAIKAAERNVPERAKRSEQGSLPESAMVRLEEQPYLRNAFKNAFREPIRASKSGLDDFFTRTRGKVQHIAVISGGSFDILKAFIAKGWAPIVIIQLQGRTPEILPVSDYNDQLSEIYLQNPINFGKRRLSYAKFEAAWSKNSRNKCVLITPQPLNKAIVRNVLGKYLPAEAFQEIGIREKLIPRRRFRPNWSSIENRQN